MTFRSEGAVAAALAAAQSQDVRCEDPFVLADTWHVLVHLRPFAIVARVSTDTEIPGGPSPADIVRELDVAAHAARRGAPVVPPTDEIDPGPHRCNGRVITFWRYVAPRGELNARDAGRALRAVHDVLLDFEGPLAAAGHPEDLDVMLEALDDSDDVEFLRRVASDRPDLDGQTLHGDAHLENCLSSSAGPLWHDFETACRGPREYDLAALLLLDLVHGGRSSARQALAAYGPHDTEVLRAVVPIYAAWVLASMLTVAPRRPGFSAVVDERLRWLRGYVGAPR